VLSGVKRHRIQLSGAKFDKVGLIRGSSPLAKGITLDLSARLWSMDGSAMCSVAKERGEWYIRMMCGQRASLTVQCIQKLNQTTVNPAIEAHGFY